MNIVVNADSIDIILVSPGPTIITIVTDTLFPNVSGIVASGLSLIIGTYSATMRVRDQLFVPDDTLIITSGSIPDLKLNIEYLVTNVTTVITGGVFQYQDVHLSDVDSSLLLKYVGKLCYL